MPFDQREIVLIPVPFTDLSATKRRPVLILSSTSHNARSLDILVAAITSNLAAGLSGIVIDAPDMEAGTLPRRSLIRADKIYTLSQSIVIARYGRLADVSFQRVLAEIDVVLGR